jgi:GWxTD domain-containing protein
MYSLLLSMMLFLPAMQLKSWSDGPVSIVLSEVEKKAFSQLKTDPERARFIERFWASRDPKPDTLHNEFLEEFDRRVSRANDLFGGDTSLEGWQTERGRYYVLLGAPSSRAQFKTSGQVRPAELWFYSGRREYPQLPSFFSLLFYQREEIGDYRQYSPFLDQPQSLVKGTIRGNADAYRILMGINADLARASMSLIPGEPVDLTSFAPSMTSDAILAQINQIPKRDYERSAMLREIVNVALRFGGGTIGMKAYSFLAAPDTFVVDLVIDRPAGVDDARVETVVYRDGKEEGRTRGAFLKEQPLTGRLLLKPGDYVIESTVSKPGLKESYVARESIQLKRAAKLTLSEIFFFSSATPSAAQPLVPLAHAGYQFTAESRRRFNPADKLQVLFQVSTPADKKEIEDRKLSIDYTIAGIHNASNRWTFHDEVAMERFDANGLLLNSKTLSIRELPPGRYFLVILATSPGGQRASQTVSFEVSEAGSSSASDRSK